MSRTAVCPPISRSTTTCPRSTRRRFSLTSNETGGPTTRPQGEVLRERYAEITAMDRAIGQLRKHLAAQGLRQDTLLFYCGDNGTSPDAALGVPHRGVKGQVYEGGTLVPGLIEWPARIPQPRTQQRPREHQRSAAHALRPGRSAAADRPLDGIDLTAVLDGKMTERPNPLFFWEYNTERSREIQAASRGSIPNCKKGRRRSRRLMGGKATRDFTNFRHPAITDDDYLGPRAIIDGRFKLVIHEQKNGDVKRELFDLKTDPAEKTNLLEQQRSTADQLQTKLRDWQKSVLQSLTGADYRK